MDSVSLAEPRRRQKWTLNPRGNLWANDESKFGQKLMEKMGWEKGKGLGANENGRVQHISLKLKDNNKGIGFEGHDDTWLEHQNDFQSVLAALNIEHGDAGKGLSENEKKANLEELSKKSKRRVHYQKFVRGKDTNNYSVEDLGCILGTKSEKVKSKSAPGSPSIKDVDNKDIVTEEDDKKFVQGGSYADYFAKKMAEMKSKGKLSSVPSHWTMTSASQRSEEPDDVQRIGFASNSIDEDEKESEASHEEPIKKKKKSKKSKEDEEQNVAPEQIVQSQENLESEDRKKKKKSKKSKKEVEETIDIVVQEEVHPKKKKSKKSKEKEKEIEEPLIEESIKSSPDEVKQKKSKKSKEKEKEIELPLIEESVKSSPDEVKQKKSKKNKKEKKVPLDDIKEDDEDIKKKKSKKSKKEKVVEETPMIENDSGCENEDTKYKKAKKVKKEKTKEKKTTYSDEEKENRKKRKSETEEEASPTKKLKTTEENGNSTKFAGFKGSNLLTISGYGTNES